MAIFSFLYTTCFRLHHVYKENGIMSKSAFNVTKNDKNTKLVTLTCILSIKWKCILNSIDQKWIFFDFGQYLAVQCKEKTVIKLMKGLYYSKLLCSYIVNCYYEYQKR